MNSIANEERINKISELIIEYCLGNFSKKIKISKALDVIDTIGSGINMLGEELHEKTVSKQYFNDIFNMVSDMIFIVDAKGKITNCNHAVKKKMDYEPENLNGTNFLSLIEDSFFKKKLKNNMSLLLEHHECQLTTKHQKPLSVLISASHFGHSNALAQQFVIIAYDNTKNIDKRALQLQTIIETQETERERIARELHDSLGQKLSAVKFYLSAMQEQNKSKKLDQMLQKSGEMLLHTTQELRNVIFNIMPKTLIDHGLQNALFEFTAHIQQDLKFKVSISNCSINYRLQLQLEIALFRIVQELSNNSIKYSGGNRISISISCNGENLTLNFADNGNGNAETILNNTSGMGIKNIKYRIESYHGSLKVYNKKPKGLAYNIIIPKIWKYINTNEKYSL